MVTKVKSNQKIMEKEKGSISLFVLVTGLFFLVLISSSYIYVKNKNIEIEKEEKAIKSSYEKDIENIDKIYEEKVKKVLPWTKGTRPYLPTEEYMQVEGTDLETGLVIEDGVGNQYVWIEVPNDGTGPNYSNIPKYKDMGTEEDNKNYYEQIEKALHAYTEVYRDGTTFKDEYYSDATTGLTQTQYNDLKKKMLKSIYENGGFYIGRYEAGIEDSFRKAKENPIEGTTPVIKANAYPYNYVTCSQAQQLANKFKPSGNKYIASLMFGVQWDLVMKYLETKGTKQDDLKLDSTNWGNYYDNTSYAIKAGAKGSTTSGSSWDLSGGYSKGGTIKVVLLTTGASDEFNKQNIYDIAGNVYEWILEYTSITLGSCAVRGGSFYSIGSDHPASYRYSYDMTYSVSHIGFRVSLY